MLHPSSHTQSTLVGASHCTSRGDFIVRDDGREVYMQPQMTRQIILWPL
jgi:hypothetical protein